jgi:hypothetical protein
MRKEYDFSNAKPNHYVKKLKRQIAVKIDAQIVEYFQKQAGALGMAYHNLIGLYLADCIATKKTLKVSWK